MNEYIPSLADELERFGAQVEWHHRAKDVGEGDFCFLLSYERIVHAAFLARHRHNLVCHASALPKGKGMSPLTWQILEGANEIPVTLFEAVEELDGGVIYDQETMQFDGHELIREMRAELADRIVSMCVRFVRTHPESAAAARPQSGAESRYSRRRPEDSRLDPERSLSEQFNLLRVVDNARYPAFFEWRGHKYTLRIEKDAAVDGASGDA